MFAKKLSYLMASACLIASASAFAEPTMMCEDQNGYSAELKALKTQETQLANQMSGASAQQQQGLSNEIQYLQSQELMVLNEAQLCHNQGK